MTGISNEFKSALQDTLRIILHDTTDIPAIGRGNLGVMYIKGCKVGFLVTTCTSCLDHDRPITLKETDLDNLNGMLRVVHLNCLSDRGKARPAVDRYLSDLARTIGLDKIVGVDTAPCWDWKAHMSTEDVAKWETVVHDIYGNC